MAANPTYVSQTNGALSSVGISVSKPAGVVDGDLLIAHIMFYIGGGADINSVPSGWTLLEAARDCGASLGARSRIYWKIASGEPSSWNWGTSGNWSHAYVCSAWRGTDTTTPINTFSGTVQTSGSPIQALTITPSVDSCLIVPMGYFKRNPGSSSITPSIPSGYTSAYAVADAQFSQAAVAAYLGQGSAAATGALDFVFDNSSNVNSVAYNLALAPLTTYVDAATAKVALTPSGVEVPGLGSGGTLLFKFTPSVNEFMLAEVGTEDFKLTASGTDAADIGELNTEELKFTPSATEALGATADAATENFKLTPIGADDPQYGLIEAGIETLHLVPAGVDEHTTFDAATENFKFTITGHDCYAQVTPSYQIDLFKRWNMGSPFARWEIDQLNTRWSVFIIGTAFEIPC